MAIWFALGLAWHVQRMQEVDDAWNTLQVALKFVMRFNWEAKEKDRRSNMLMQGNIEYAREKE